MEKQKKELQHETLHSTAEVTIEDTDLQYLKDIILLKWYFREVNLSFLMRYDFRLNMFYR